MVIATCLHFLSTLLKSGRGGPLRQLCGHSLAITTGVCLVLVGFVVSNANAWQDDTQTADRETVDDPVPSILRNGMLQTDIRLELRPDGGYALTNITIEELRRLERQSNAAAQLPAASIVQSIVNVSAVEEGASVEGAFDVRLGSSQTPALIDLRFGACRLVEPPARPEGDVQSLFQVNPGTGGYQWLLLGEENSQHRLVLKGKTPVRQKADRFTLAIDLPSALTTINVLLPHDAIDERVRSDDILERTVTEAGVRLKINSRGGDFTLTWRQQDGMQRIAALEAESNTTFDIIDPAQPWSVSTSVTVRSYGNESKNSFRIKLPPGAQWRTYPNPALDRFRITTVAAETDAGEVENLDGENQAARAPQLLVEKLDPLTTDSIEFDWEWLPDSIGEDGNTTEFKIPIPAISDVDRHEGTFNCIFQSSYAAVFQEGPGVRLIQQGRLQMQQSFSNRHQMQFQFDRQDFQLNIRLRKEESLPTIRPTYKVHVDQHKLVLTAWFECSFDTNEPRMEFGLIPGDWIVEENSARMLRDPQNPYSLESEVINSRREDDGSYILSGREPESTFANGRRIEQVWRIVAQRSWSPDDNNALEFRIPEIKRMRANGSAEVDHGSGVLLLTSENNVVTRWRETASTGLLPDSFSNEYEKYLSKSQVREPLAYRFQSRGTTPNWAGLAEFLPQQIACEHHAAIEVLSNEVLVRQDFDLRIANDPLSNFMVYVREDVRGVPQISIDGNPVSIQAVGKLTTRELGNGLNAPAAEEKADVVATGVKELPWKQYQIVGAPKLLGNSKLSIWTEVPWTMGTKGANAEQVPSVDVQVPLVQVQFPPATRRIRQDWSLTNDVKFDITSTDSTPAISETQVGNKRRPLRDNQLYVGLKLRQKESVAEAHIHVSGSWLQSVITGNERRDRFVALVHSDSGKLNIKLPNPAQIEKVAVNGVPVEQSSAPYDYNTKSLSIALPTTPTKQTHVIELFYFMDETLSWVSTLHIQPPMIEDAVNLDRYYWQLVVPSMHHLGWSPKGMTAEWTWNWNGMWWHRESGEDQASLEQWLGSSVQTRQSLSANSYVMSGQGVFRPQTVRVLSRFALWLPMGLLAIVLSVLTLSFSFLRSPVVAIVLAVAIASLAMVWPDMAVLFGQTALISLSLVVLIFVTQAAIDTRVRRRSVFTTRPTTYVDGSEQNSVGRGTRAPISTAIRTGSSVVVSEEK